MIRLQNVSKTFRLYRKPSDRLKEIVLRRRFHTEHHALADISFELPRGQTLGIIGQNGAGKSTLLKLLTGVLLPDSGDIAVDGRITGLLELGTGFNADMSGLDNLDANATLLGMSPEHIDARREAILAFAELGEFIHEPLKTYSSGMTMRLGFAIAIHADPTCFVVDEALSVGDAYFQQKCIRAIQDFRDRGGSVLFVSHDMNAVRALCDHAIMLEGGRIIDRGTPRDVVDHYHARVLRKSHLGNAPVSVNPPAGQGGGAPLAGTGEVVVEKLEVRNRQGLPVEHIVSEEPVTIVVLVRATRDLDQPHYGIGLRNRFGHSVFETNTYCVRHTPPPLAGGETVRIEWRFDANLIAGDYAISVGVGNRPHGTGSFEEILFFSHDLAMLKVEVNPDAIRYDGYFNLHPAVQVSAP